METINRRNSRSTLTSISIAERNAEIPSPETVDKIFSACVDSFEKLENYYNMSSDYCVIAIVLDPRLKLDFYHDQKKSDKENGDLRKKIWNQVDRVFRANYCLDDANQQPRKSSSRIFKKFKTDSDRDELQWYLTRFVRTKGNTDPLEWWKSHIYELPKLSRMARDYLCIAGVSERAFSGGKRNYLLYNCCLLSVFQDEN